MQQSSLQIMMGQNLGECEMFQLFWKTDTMQDVHVKLNTGLP
jgi:hypothetical protein